jgi:putative nucleotidyltransferase with HDIG domain
MKILLPKEAKEIMQKLKKGGFQAFAVGGCVRDILIGRQTKDWDFTTDAQPPEIQALFPKSYYDNKYGTVGIPIKKNVILSGAKNPPRKTANGWDPSSRRNLGTQDDKVIYEITTFRSELGYTDYRHPDKIIFGKTLEEDLKRRDFTINAIATDGNKIIDPFDGRSDLKDKLIRAVGRAKERFQEDALRMMRAVRITTELQFLIEEDTFEAIRRNAHLITKISSERIRDELLKIMSSDFPADGIKLLRNSRLLEIILPELDKCFGIEQKSPQRHHLYDVGTHLIMSLQSCSSKDPIVRLATLLHDIGKAPTFNKTKKGVITFYNHEIVGTSIVRNIAQKLHFSRKDRDRLIRLVRYHQFTVDERQTDSAVRRFIRNVGKENLEDILALRTGDRLGGGARETSWRLELFKKRLLEVQKQPFTVSDLKIDGYDVMKIYQISPGPLVGTVLDMLFNDVVEGKIKNEKEILLKRIFQLKKESEH